MSFLGGYSWRQLLSCRLPLWLTSDNGGGLWIDDSCRAVPPSRPPSRPTHECLTGIVFPRWCGIYNEMILKVANAARCRRINACQQAARRVLLSMRHGVALSSRTGIDLSTLDFGTLCAAGVCLLRCNISADLLVHGVPPAVELCSHSAAVKGSDNHSAGCTLFAQTPGIAPLSRVGLLWVMAECVMLESTTFSCRTQKVLIFLLFLQEMVLFYSFFYSVSLTTADNTQHLPNHCCPYSEQIFKGLGPCGHGDHDTGTLNTLYFALSYQQSLSLSTLEFLYVFFFPRKQIMLQE